MQARINKQQGFTLVEILVVVAIIGIIAAIAVPSYQQSVRKGRRSDAYSMLNEVMQTQERKYAGEIPHTYTTALAADLGFVADTVLSDKGFYNVTAAACADGSALTVCVLLTAAPVGPNNQAKDIVNGFGPNLMLNSRGTKQPQVKGWWGR